jgi:hypothetical protein
MTDTGSCNHKNLNFAKTRLGTRFVAGDAVPLQVRWNGKNDEYF